MFQVRKEKDCQPQILSRLYKNILPTLSENILQGQRKIQTFSGGGKRREPATSWPAGKGGWRVLRAQQKGQKREPQGLRKEGRTPFTKIWLNGVAFLLLLSLTNDIWWLKQKFQQCPTWF